MQKLSAARRYSLFAKNLGQSLRSLSHLYAKEGAETPFPCTSRPDQPWLEFVAKEMCMSVKPLKLWRSRQWNQTTLSSEINMARFNKQWKLAPPQQLTVSGSEVHAHEGDLMLSFVRDLHGVLSPFLGVSFAESGSRCEDYDVATRSTQLIAARDIEAGMFLFSIPTENALLSEAPVTEVHDELMQHFLHTDDLIAQLNVFAGDSNSVHHTYANYLRQTVLPPLNLPFMKTDQLESPDLLPLWTFFHKEMECQPLNEYLAKTLTPEEYLWYVSVVMSRRSGVSMIIPLLDKLNHDPSPNAYFTMATESSFCGLDVVDNIIAGVEDHLLLVPHVHVFAINVIPRGSPITISYSSEDPRTPRGRDTWRLNWGFVPTEVSAYQEAELKTVAGIVAARRVERLSELFPGEKD